MDVVRRTAILIIALTISVLQPVVAENDAENLKNGSPPSITNLPADWWSYIEASPSDQRKLRIDLLLRAIRGVTDAAPVRQQNRLKTLLDEIESLSRNYYNLVSNPAKLSPASDTVADAYSFNEFLKLHTRQREVRLEIDLIRGRLDSENRAVSRTEKHLSDQKASYLEMNELDPRRLPSALEIIAERFRVAIQDLEIHRQKSQLKLLESKLKKLGTHIQTAIKKLTIDQQDISVAKKKVHEYLDRIQNKRRIALKLRNQSIGSDESLDSILEQSKEKVHSARLLTAEAEIIENEVLAQRYQLQADYMEARLDPSNVRLARLRSSRNVSNDLIGGAIKTIEAWRIAVARERSRVLEILSDDKREGFNERRPQAEEQLQVINDFALIATHLDVELARLQFIELQSAEYLSEKAGAIADYFASTVDILQKGWRESVYWASTSLFEINETPVTLLGLLRVVIILTVAVWLSKAVRHGLQRLMTGGDTMSQSSIYLLGRIFHYIILTAAFLFSLSSLGLDFTKLAFLAGAFGVGIGFGLQAIFSNFISGIIVLFERSLKVGDFVELESGITGDVREINIRSTLITTNDNIDILVPNSEFVNGRVTNWTLRDVHRRTRIPFGVAYGSDKDLVKSAVLEAAEKVPFTLKGKSARQPQVWLVEFADSSLNFELVVWLTRDAVAKPATVHAAYTWAIHTALLEHDIEIPFPQRDLNVRSFFGRKDASGLDWFDNAGRQQGLGNNQ